MHRENFLKSPPYEKLIQIKISLFILRKGALYSSFITTKSQILLKPNILGLILDKHEPEVHT